MSHLFLYRIVKRKWIASAFDGEGAKRFGGRWNSKGRPCIYLAGSESLALLEVLVHLESDTILKSYSLLKCSIPKSNIMTLGNALPTNWQSEPAPPETAEIGDQWLNSKQSLALQIPSVIVPRENNYLLNPMHPDINIVEKSISEIDIQIDSRLLR